MNNIWEKFIDLHNGLFLAREPFEDLCYAILDKHFPGRAIISVGELKKSNPKKLSVFFLSKLFSGELTNSRKGQIRKAFNKFVAYQKESKQKTRAWVFCVSTRLNNDEMMWWINWKTKASQINEIDIQLFDGDTIIEHAKKYNLYNKWFLENKEVAGENKKEVVAVNEKNEKKEKLKSEDDKKENFSFELIPDNKKKTDEKKYLLEKETNHSENIKKEKIKTEEVDDEKLKKETNHSENIKKEEIDDKKLKKETNHSENIKKEKRKKETNHQKEKETKNSKLHTNSNKKEKKIVEKVKKNNKNHLNNKITPAQKITFKFKFDYFKSEFERIKLFADKLSKKEKEKLKEIIQIKEWEKLFELKENLKTTTLKLFYKAKSYEIRKKYVQSVFVYEHIFKTENYKEVLKFKLEDSYKALNKCQENVQAELYELEGDIYFIRNNKVKAIELYEKSYKLNKSNKLYAKKFYETLGDSQIENELPEEAINSYKNAIKNDKTNDELEIKLQNAKHLSKGKKFFKSMPFSLLNVFISPFEYWAAHSTINNKTTKEKLNSSSKKFFFTITAILLIVVVLFFAFNDNFTFKNIKPNKIITSNIFIQSKTMIKPISLESIAIAKGDEIMNNISLNNIHLVDTAIFAYKRALYFNSNSQLAYTQLKKAETYQKEYLSKAQANILLDSAAYFVSMRRDSEGLRLFKYLFKANDKSQGKYGYVDSNLHIVIPPVYDFNYRKMYKGTENFNNGKAIVCLVYSKGDTNYYKIDKYNRLKIKL